MVTPGTPLRFQLAIEQRGHSPIAVSCTLGDNRTDLRHQPSVVGLRVWWLSDRRLKSLDQVGACDSHRSGHRFHLESPPPGQLERNSSFFERVSSRASFRISASSVFLPSSRSSSRTRARSCLASESGTTCSSAPKLSSSPDVAPSRTGHGGLDIGETYDQDTGRDRGNRGSAAW